ncbi:unnamed protein product, partial [Rotaria socialis]
SAGADEVLSVPDARIFDVCYGEYGCFTIRPPFGATLQRPIAVLPAAVERYNEFAISSVFLFFDCFS